jgi:hypothetical protein
MAQGRVAAVQVAGMAVSTAAALTAACSQVAVKSRALLTMTLDVTLASLPP